MKRMSKTTGNKISIDKNWSFARFTLSWIQYAIPRYGKKKSHSGSPNDAHALLQPPTLWTEPATQKPTDNPVYHLLLMVYKL